MGVKSSRIETNFTNNFAEASFSNHCRVKINLVVNGKLCRLALFSETTMVTIVSTKQSPSFRDATNKRKKLLRAEIHLKRIEVEMNSMEA